MIEYKFDTKDKYVKEIISHLVEFEKPFVSDTEKESFSFYAIENESLVGAINVYYSWNWVIVLSLYYDNALVLKDMIYELCKRYKSKANGVHFRTYDNDKLQDFVKLGFTHSATLKLNTDHDDLNFADLMNLEFEHTPKYEVKSQGEKDKVYQQMLETNAKKDLSKVRVPQLIDDVTIVAFDEGMFAGGLVAKANEDSFHIDLLAVPLEHRRKNIGTKLMMLAEEEARKRDIFTMDLSTGEFQAKPFYSKLGYKVVYTRQNCPRGYENYKLIKHLDN